jgi:hypothetical protein
MPIRLATKRSIYRENQYYLQGTRSALYPYMRLTVHVTLNFNNNMSTAAVFLDIEKTVDAT